MIADTCQDTQLPIDTNEFFKFEIKICQKDRCGEVCIPNGKYCEKHRVKPQPKCEHGKRKYNCKKCGGSHLCEHNRQKSHCKECGGGSICEHNTIRSKCKKCKGGSVCEHSKTRSRCKKCSGGQICEHGRIKSACIECEGGQICEHLKRRSRCKECNFVGYLSDIVRSRIYKSLKFDKELKSQEYLGCNIEKLKKHIESQFKEGMTWDNYGKWHIDHIIPLKYEKDEEIPKLEETIKRLHYTNTQPLWATDNISKGNRFIG